LIPTVSVAGNWLILFNGNIIAKESTIVKASRMADYFSIVNIRDKEGKSTWAAKNSEEDIDKILSKISFISAQTEYFNNPVEEGTVFKEIVWDKVPPLNRFKFLVAYGDPAPSNKENKTGCFKSIFLIGCLDGKFYIITGFLNKVNNSRYVDWYYDIEDFVRQRSHIYNYIENNSLQDPFFEQVFTPLFNEKAKEKGHYISINPDPRKKPDKFVRIEGNLEPLNRNSKLIFNEAERQNPNMILLESQFKAVDPKLSAPVDGPDCIEGGIFIINSKMRAMAPMTSVPRSNIKNKKRF